MDDLRKFALDMAATSMRGASFTEIVNAAQAFHAFLEPRNEIPESAKTILGGASPPPIPELVQQVRHDASQLGPESLSSAPPGFRGEMPDLSQADQSPKWGPITGEYPLMSFDDDTKTRIVCRT